MSPNILNKDFISYLNDKSVFIFPIFGYIMAIIILNNTLAKYESRI